MTDEEIIAAIEAEPDALLGHFSDLRERDWCAVSSEGLRVLSLVEGSDATGSAADAVQSAVALRAQRGAYEAVAEMLGLDAERLESVANYWAEDRLIGRPAIDFPTLERLMALSDSHGKEFFALLPPEPDPGDED